MTLPTRQQAISAAAIILADPATVFLKVETTGLGNQDEVVEIAIVHALTGDVLLNSLVKPSFRYAMHDKLKHGIRYDSLADAPVITALNIPSLLRDKRVIVYGKDFARKMISQSYAAHGVGFNPDCEWNCAMTLYGAYEQVMSEYGSGHKWWKFDDALENLHVNNERRNHRALEEAKTIGLLLYQIAYRGDAVKVKRDPLPRPVLDFDEIDAPPKPREPYDQSAFFASSGYPDNEDDFENEDRDDDDPMYPSEDEFFDTPKGS